MSSSILAKNAQARLTAIGAEAGALASNSEMSKRAKGRRLDALQDEVEECKSTIAAHKSAMTVTLDNGQTVPLGLFSNGNPAEASQFVAKSGMPGVLGQAPALGLSDDALHAMHEAVLSRKSFRADATVKDATASGAGMADNLPAQFGGFVPIANEPVRVLDLIPTKASNAPVIEFLRHDSTTGAAGMVAPGTLKPSATIVTTRGEVRARKIAVTAMANDEDLADFAQFTSYLQNELIRLVINVENAQVLSGDGTGENLLGLLNQSGILTRALGADTALDALEEAITDLRVGPAYCEPTAFVMAPATWSKIRRTKDLQGRYLVTPDPTAQGGSTLWGIPVATTTDFPAGEALVMNAGQGAAAYVRQGITFQVDYGQNGFEHNTTSFRAEERLGVYSPRPSALLKVTGL